VNCLIRRIEVYCITVLAALINRTENIYQIMSPITFTKQLNYF